MMLETDSAETIVNKQTVLGKCHVCNNDVELAPGQVIFGDKWFHNSCWKINDGGNYNDDIKI